MDVGRGRSPAVRYSAWPGSAVAGSCGRLLHAEPRDALAARRDKRKTKSPFCFPRKNKISRKPFYFRPN